MRSQIKKDNNSQNELIELLQKGNKESMENLYQNYSAALYGIILPIIKQEEIAKEILQDTFVKIWEKSSSFDQEKGRLFTWMARIARNTAIDHLRSKSFKNGQRLDTSCAPYDLENKTQTQMTLSDSGLLNTINKLDKKYKDVLFTIYLHGFTQKQTSEQLSISLSTVKTRSKTALKLMSQLLRSEEYLYN